MPSDPDCIFCKIAAGHVPVARIAESPQALAFLDVGPIATGHALIIPREHYETLMDMPEDRLAAVYAMAAHVASALTRALGAEGVNVLQNNGRCAGQVVPHMHVHVIPRSAGDGIKWPWPATKADPDALETLARRIVSRLDAP